MAAFRTVYVVDDDRSERRQISACMLDCALDAHPFTETDFVDEVSNLPPGCAVIEVFPKQIPHYRPLDAASLRGNVLPSIAMCEHCTTGLAVSALKHGAVDVYDKLSPLGELVDMVHSTLRHLPEAIDKEQAAKSVINKLLGLSRREFQVLWLVSQGLLSKQIGHELGVSGRTIDMHRQGLMRRLDISKVSDAVYMLQSVGGRQEIVDRVQKDFI